MKRTKKFNPITINQIVGNFVTASQEVSGSAYSAGYLASVLARLISESSGKNQLDVLDQLLEATLQFEAVAQKQQSK